MPLQTGSVAPPPAVNTAQAKAASADLNNSGQMTAGTGAALLFAFLGGLILNLMPCVFPVLSLKLLDLVQGAHQSQRLIGHGLAFTGGVLLSMVLLSGTLMALRTAGHAVGWGFQLQSPWVVAALILLFGAIACNLLGLYEFTFGSRAADLKVVRSLPQSGITSFLFLRHFWRSLWQVPAPLLSVGAGIGYALTQPRRRSNARLPLAGSRHGNALAAFVPVPRLGQKAPQTGTLDEHLQEGDGCPHAARTPLARLGAYQAG